MISIPRNVLNRLDCLDGVRCTCVGTSNSARRGTASVPLQLASPRYPVLKECQSSPRAEEVRTEICPRSVWKERRPEGTYPLGVPVGKGIVPRGHQGISEMEH